MNVQHILTAILYILIISFFMLITYCEVAKLALKKVLQIPEELQNDLRDNTVLEEHPKVYEEHQPTIEDIKPKEQSTTPINTKQLDLTKKNIAELRKQCSQMNITWRSAAIDIKTGKKRHLRKAEMVAALQRLSA